MNKLVFLFILCSAIHSCASEKVAAQRNIVPANRPLAFPGAEGWGKYATGGRGGAVFIVSNLNDGGAGSFRQAAEKKIPRIIVFAVSGIIHLTSRLNIAANATIAGQTAPGDGICIADHPVVLAGDNIIIRYLRFRMGDKNQKGGMVDGNGSDDALGGSKRNNIIIDHCSLSWSTDEVLSVYAGDSTTLQWNLVSEPLNYSYHFEAGDKDYEHHGFGGIMGGKHISIHHNLFAHCTSRTPRFDGIRNSPVENADFRNNVIYNWGTNNVYAGEGGNYNIINNYYRYGPSTGKEVRFRVANPYKKLPAIPYGKWYVDGNYVDGSPGVTQNNWTGVVMNDGTEEDAEKAKASAPFSYEAVKTQPAKEAYEIVLQKAGAILPVRDTLDERIIKDVINRTGKLIDVQGGYDHGTPYEYTVNAWPALRSLPAPVDGDADGMPDDWEKKNGLNPSVADDAAHTLSKWYTNIEIYLYSLGGEDQEPNHKNQKTKIK